MPAKKVACVYCNKELRFIDIKDLTYAKHDVVGFSVDKDAPIVICNICVKGKLESLVKSKVTNL